MSLKRTSDNYRFTVVLENGKPDAEGQARIDALKAEVRAANKGQRVKLMPRLGKNNPNAQKYRESRAWNAYQYIKMADGQTADVYVNYKNLEARLEHDENVPQWIRVLYS